MCSGLMNDLNVPLKIMLNCVCSPALPRRDYHYSSDASADSSEVYNQMKLVE